MFKSILRWYIQNLITKLEHPSDDVAVKAERRLIWLGKRTIPQMLPKINHADPRVRFRAVWVLGKTRDPAAFDAIRSCVEDSDHRVAYDAMMALGELGDSRAVPLLEALASKYHGHPDSLDSAAKSALLKLGVESYSTT